MANAIILLMYANGTPWHMPSGKLAEGSITMPENSGGELTERLPTVRVTPEEKAKVELILQIEQKTYSDFVRETFLADLFAKHDRITAATGADVKAAS